MKITAFIFGLIMLFLVKEEYDDFVKAFMREQTGNL